MTGCNGGHIERVELARWVNPATNRPGWRSAWVGVCTCGWRSEPASNAGARKALNRHIAEIRQLDAALVPVPQELA